MVSALAHFPRRWCELSHSTRLLAGCTVPGQSKEGSVHSDLALKITADLLWTGLLVCAPVLGLTLGVGLVVSVLQVITQVQELSLTFVLIDGWTLVLRALVGSFH
jgi:flagellar biosynthesis protein FliQ